MTSEFIKENLVALLADVWEEANGETAVKQNTCVDCGRTIRGRRQRCAKHDQEHRNLVSRQSMERQKAGTQRPYQRQEVFAT